jgi:hypothetical protein
MGLVSLSLDQSSPLGGDLSRDVGWHRTVAAAEIPKALVCVSGTAGETGQPLECPTVLLDKSTEGLTAKTEGIRPRKHLSMLSGKRLELAETTASAERQ